MYFTIRIYIGCGIETSTYRFTYYDNFYYQIFNEVKNKKVMSYQRNNTILIIVISCPYNTLSAIFTYSLII